MHLSANQIAFYANAAAQALANQIAFMLTSKDRKVKTKKMADIKVVCLTFFCLDFLKVTEK